MKELIGKIEQVISKENPCLDELASCANDLFEQVEGEQLLSLPVEARVGRMDATHEECACELLKKMLATAIAIEFSTIPPYLCALWSIKDELDPAAKSIREIVQEEMLHMSLACNMLVSIGGSPNLIRDQPTYPGKLPGNLHPELTVFLSGLNDDALDVFMTIEHPDHPIDIAPCSDCKQPTGIQQSTVSSDRLCKDAATIGRFYNGLQNLFHALAPGNFSVQRQISGPLADLVIKSLDDVDAAIQTIIEQGEGTPSSPQDTGVDDLAHFYRFAELKRRQRIQFDGRTDQPCFGEAFPFPDCLPMRRIPEDGYDDERLSEEANGLLRNFDITYSIMLDSLNHAWNGGGQASFYEALQLMFKLEQYAKPLMEIPVEEGAPETLGPRFQYVATDKRTGANDE